MVRTGNLLAELELTSRAQFSLSSSTSHLQEIVYFQSHCSEHSLNFYSFFEEGRVGAHFRPHSDKISNLKFGFTVSPKYFDALFLTRLTLFVD